MSIINKLHILAADNKDVAVYRIARSMSRPLEWLAFADDEDSQGSSNLVRHATHELSLIKGDPEDSGTMQNTMNSNIIDLIKLFSKQGHSGFSAGYLTNALEKLMRFEPLTPLQGTPDEWFIHNFDDNLYAQNKRCSHVFMRRDGTAYDINGIIFQHPNGACFSSSDSRVEVKFPYTPKTNYVKVPSWRSGEGNSATTERSAVTSSTKMECVARYITTKELKAAYRLRYVNRDPKRSIA